MQHQSSRECVFAKAFLDIGPECCDRTTIADILTQLVPSSGNVERELAHLIVELISTSDAESWKLDDVVYGIFSAVQLEMSYALVPQVGPIEVGV